MQIERQLEQRELKDMTKTQIEKQIEVKDTGIAYRTQQGEKEPGHTVRDIGGGRDKNID